MPQPLRALTPERSPRHLFGSELRRHRNEWKLSQEEAARLLYVSESKLAKVEKAERWPDEQLAAAADQLFRTGGTFANLWLLVAAERHDPAGEAYKQASDAYFSVVRATGDGSAPTMELRLNQEGDIVAEINRRTVLIASATSLAYLARDPGNGSLIPAQPAASDDPFGFARTVSHRWPQTEVARAASSRGGVDWQLLLPGGRNMLGTEAGIQLHPARMVGRKAVVSLPDARRADDFVRRTGRGLIVGAVSEEADEEQRFYLFDAREARMTLQPTAGSYELAVPDGYELDDLTYGILWAVANLDDALQADDHALHEARHDLKAYERLSASAVSRESAPGLNPIAHMYLGSDFCARYILRSLGELHAKPVAWTREQRGEEASTWLLFDHKYTYLRDTVSLVGGSMERGFCIPESAVVDSPRHERIMLFLAVALMESLRIHVQLTTDPSYERVEGFVLAPQKQEAIIANWVGGDGMWHVDLTTKSAVVRQFEEVAGDVGAESHIEAASPARRLQGFADYLGLDWAWLIRRCAQLGRRGTDRLVQSRSRLISPAGLDAACQYVGSLSSVTD